MARASSAVALLAALLVAAGCGTPPPPKKDVYSLGPTRKCLVRAGVHVTTRVKDFVASTAPAGALQGVVRRKPFTISFGDTKEQARRMAAAYRRLTNNKKRLRSLLDPEGNAVILWTTEPLPRDADLVRACLS
jgi:hypothetical protein